MGHIFEALQKSVAERSGGEFPALSSAIELLQLDEREVPVTPETVAAVRYMKSHNHLPQVPAAAAVNTLARNSVAIETHRPSRWKRAVGAATMIGIVVVSWFGWRLSHLRYSDSFAPVTTRAHRTQSTSGSSFSSESTSQVEANVISQPPAASSANADLEFADGAGYALGHGVPHNYAEAVRWYLKAAEHGSVSAQSLLGEYYWKGRGVPKDNVTAYKWSAIAQSAGDTASKYRIALLRSQMKQSDVKEAQRLASDWLSQHTDWANR
jgi:hypothetical protein